MTDCPKCKSATLHDGQVLCGACSKLDTGKPTYAPTDLLLLAEIKRFEITEQVRGLIEVLRFGERKYAIHSWRNVPPEKYYSALTRHLVAEAGGERLDPDSGLLHWDHIACNVAFLREMKLDGHTPARAEICHFCNKTQREVGKLIAAATGALICDECIGQAVKLMEQNP